jgi:hypothetical protein
MVRRRIDPQGRNFSAERSETAEPSEFEIIFTPLP